MRSYDISRVFTVVLAAYVELFRGTPLLVQLFFIYYGLPSVGIVMDAFTAAVIGLGLNGGAYMSETVRASILSVPKGQEEAAFSLVLTGLRRYGISYCLKLYRWLYPFDEQVFFMLKETS